MFVHTCPSRVMTETLKNDQQQKRRKGLGAPGASADSSRERYGSGSLVPSSGRHRMTETLGSANMRVIYSELGDDDGEF